MDGLHNPGWVKAMSESKGSNGGRATDCQVWSKFAAPTLVGELTGYGLKCKASLRSGGEVDIRKAQQLQENNDCEKVSIEEALASLERMVELPSIDDYISILQKCREKKNLAYAKRVHMHICDNGLKAHRALGNYLVPMFVDCGSMSDAHQVFEGLFDRNEYSWTSLIQGYMKCGESQQALDLYQDMQQDRVHPSRYTFVALLRACARLKCVERGREIHAEIFKEGYERDFFVSNTLVDMYAKCGSLVEAQDMFDELPVRDVVSWTAIIAGFAEHGPGEQALNHFLQMQLEGVSPSAATFVSSLKACGSIGAVDMGQEMHAEIAKQGYERDPYVGNTLVDMYAKCGSLAEAQEVFEELPFRDLVSWNALIAGYAEDGLGEEVLKYLQQMQLEGISPDAVTFVSSLKACGSIGATERGREIHTDIVKQGLERNCFVGNTMVDMYAKCGSIAEAQEVFDKLPVLDAVSWNALIAGYAERGLGEEALKCFQQMQLEGMSPNAVTFICSLKACGSIRALDQGREMHIEIAKQGLERDHFVGSTLLDMYVKCGSIGEAQEVFDNLPVRDVVLWTALIAGYAEHRLGEEALKCFQQMQLLGMPPNAVTFGCSLKACGSIGAIDRGQEIHAKTAKMGFDRDYSVGNNLVDMYAKCGLLAEAQEVLGKLPVRDTVSWTALIAGFVEHRLDEEALYCLDQMQLEGASPDIITFVCSLEACGSTAALERGREINIELAKRGFEENPVVASILVDMYAKCGSLAEAQEVFDKLPVRDVVLWTALIAGYAENGLVEEALSGFQLMQLEGVSPDVVLCNVLILGYAEQGEIEEPLKIYAQMQEESLSPNSVTFGSILKACGNVAAIETGKKIHAQILRVGGLGGTEVILTNTLIDMYGKCGSMADAQQVFDAMLTRVLGTWNALITGYARQGESEVVFHLFEKMREEGIRPDGITFLSVLTVCSHAGLMGEGQKHFEAMNKEYGLIPVIKHYSCMVDLLGRAGQLDKAVAMLEKMPYQPDLVAWSTVMGACQKCGNVDLGSQAFEYVVRLGEKHAAAFILMSNIFADIHM